MKQKCPKSRKDESQIKKKHCRYKLQSYTPLRTNKYQEIIYSRRWSHREVFQKDGTLEGIRIRGRE